MTKVRFYVVFVGLLAFLWASWDVSNAWGQQSRSRRTKSVEQEESVSPSEEEEGVDTIEELRKLPPKKPIRVPDEELKTKDGVVLSATYYPSNLGKYAVPVILLHSWEGSRKEFSTLAPHLQKLGYAVLVPDLRGHGKSNRQETEPEVYEEFKVGRFNADTFNAMVLYDLPQLKRFLMRENNAGRLNIDKLGLVGIEMGALLAGTYASKDWAPNVKRNKRMPFTGDVKGIVVISTPKNFSGLKFIDTLNNPNWVQNMSALILSGAASREVEKPKLLKNQIMRKLRVKDSENIFDVQLDVNLQGAKLIAVVNSDAVKLIAEFLQLRLEDREFPWENRSKN
ncbi:MAG: alpha/beta fold hydrolase [Planctomycetia bacterium]|nr:alpha/beta fold hydrolase [Planctomycetia bacterium]